MRRSLLCMITTLIVFSCSSQTTYTWIGANNASWAISTNWSPVRSAPATNDILQFNDGTTKTILSVPTQTIGKLSITNNTSITLNSASNNRTLTLGNITGNDLVIAGGSTMTIGSANSNFSITLANSAAADISGRLIVNSGQTYNTNNTSVVTTVSPSGYIQNSGTVSCTNAAKLVFAASAVYEHAANGGAVPTATWNAASNLDITGVTTAVPTGLSQSFGHFTWDCAGQTASVNLGGALTTVNGNLTIANTNGSTRHVLLGNNNTVTLNVGGDITVGSTGGVAAVLDMDASNGNITINFPGDLVTLGNGQIDNTGNNNATFNFNSNTGTQLINLGNSTSFAAAWGGNFNVGTGATSNTVVLQTNMALNTVYNTNIVVANGSTFDMGAYVISNKGTFNANSGSSLLIGNAGGIASTGSTGNIQVTTSRTFSTGADYEYNGSVAQVTGTGLPATVNRLIIDNASGVNTGAGVTLSQSTAVANELVLTNSFLKTSSANMLTINNGAIATVTNNSFVDGPLRKIGNSNFTFPTGWSGIGGGRIPITVSSLSASATMQAEYKRATSSTVGATLTLPLNHVSYCEYWELFPASGSVTATITMYWNAYSNCSPAGYVNNFATLLVARSNGSTWTSVGNTGGSLGSGTIISNTGTTINNTTPLKYFALASSASSSNPLPVTFTDIRAYEKDNGVQVEWTNLSEKDIASYNVQHAVNGRDFTDMHVQLPYNNQGDRASYTDIDMLPATATNYYRIKATSTNGNVSYTRILRVEKTSLKQELSLYPNPVVANELTFSLSNVPKGLYRLALINTSGQQLYQAGVMVQGAVFTQQLVLPATIKPGMYTLLVTGVNYRGTKLFTMQ